MRGAGFKAVFVIFGRTIFHFGDVAGKISIPAPLSTPSAGTVRI
ncbi:hypothetical protein BOSEA31B_13020 [Hyphomicrobiales bacterium]|nr:hypothetical protein BOSEA31B_13020 [Hyphomicrobiales bacterium]